MRGFLFIRFMGGEHIVRRLRYEAWGTKYTPHNPSWGNETLGLHNSDSFITSFVEVERLKELKANPALEKIAKRWATQSVNRLLDGSIWASYATSGSETNGKEGLQLTALLQAMYEQKIRNVAGIYFIDTASHPMNPQLTAEAEMYSTTTTCKMDNEEAKKLYLNLFRGKVNQGYIDQLITNLGLSEEEASSFRKKWAKQCESLNVPADAILIPEMGEYITFCEKVGIAEEVIHAIKNAFEFVKAREDIPQTLGSLRCAIFSEVTSLLTRKLGINLPIVASPFDEAAIITGWGELTMEQIRSFSAETFTDRIAYYNVLDPITGIEKPLYNREKTRVETSEGLPQYSSITYRDMMKYGHFSGMGYYQFLLTNGIGSLAFVLDNYEANGPHRRLLRAEKEGRIQSGVKMVCYPRGWVRIASFERDENSTYGASPPIEILVSEILKSTNGIEKLLKYLDLMNRNIGNNVTVSLDVSSENLKMYFVPNNRNLVISLREKEKHNEIQVPYKDIKKALSSVQTFINSPNSSTLHEIFVQGIVIPDEQEEILLREFLHTEENYHRVVDLLKHESANFEEMYYDQLKKYRINQQRAIMIAISQLGLILETPPLLCDHQHKIKIDNGETPNREEGLSIQVAQSTAEILYSQARKSIEKEANANNPKVSERISSYYLKICNAIQVTQEYLDSLRTEKAIKSLVKALSKNQMQFETAWNMYRTNQQTSDPIISNLIQQIKILTNNQNYPDLGNAMPNEEELMLILDQVTKDIEKKSTELIESYGCKPDNKRGGLKNGEPELIQRKCSTVKKMIEAISGTKYEDRFFAQIVSSSEDIESMYAICLALAPEIAREISAGLRGKTEITGNKQKFDSQNAIEYVCQYIKIAEQLLSFKRRVHFIWRSLNNEDEEIKKFTEIYDNYRNKIASLVHERNSLQEKMGEMGNTINRLVNKYISIVQSTIIEVT